MAHVYYRGPTEFLIRRLGPPPGAYGRYRLKVPPRPAPTASEVPYRRLQHRFSREISLDVKVMVWVQ